MLICSQLKLSERRSGRKLRNVSIGGGSMVLRPCTQRNITEVPQKLSSAHQITEKRLPELRVVSLNLEDQPNTNNDKKITRTPYRMPLFCAHFKSLRKNYQRDKKDVDEDFLVRGFEVGTTGATNPLTESNTIITEDFDPDEEDLKFLQNGIRIQLTDCCQCVCDLFNSNFQISQDDLSFVTIDTCNSLRPFRPKDVVQQQQSSPTIETQANNILDPNILKVIRVTMNTKTLNRL